MKRYFAALVLLAAASSAQAQGLGDRLLATYAKLESYCDAGSQIDRPVAAGGILMQFERCASKDGRYREIVRLESPARNINSNWSDGQTRFHFSGYYDHGLRTIYYDTSPVKARVRDDVSPLVRRIFIWFRVVDEYEQSLSLRERLNAFASRPEWSSGDLDAYQAPSRVIIWVSRTDGLIRRSAWVPENGRGLEVKQLQVNRMLSLPDLLFEVPLRSRVWHALIGNLLLSAIGVSIGAYLLGLAFWRIRWNPASEIDDVREHRTSMWRRFRKVAGIASAVVITIVALGWALRKQGGGDMPLILFLIPLAILCFFALWLVACFLGARHLAEPSR